MNPNSKKKQFYHDSYSYGGHKKFFCLACNASGDFAKIASKNGKKGHLCNACTDDLLEKTPKKESQLDLSVETNEERGGLPCVLAYNYDNNFYVGYVGVPKGHVFYKTNYESLEVDGVYGGLRFSSLMPLSRQKELQVTKYSDYWWFAFDIGVGIKVKDPAEKGEASLKALSDFLIHLDTKKNKQCQCTKCKELAFQDFGIPEKWVPQFSDTDLMKQLEALAKVKDAKKQGKLKKSLMNDYLEELGLDPSALDYDQYQKLVKKGLINPNEYYDPNQYEEDKPSLQKKGSIEDLYKKYTKKKTYEEDEYESSSKSEEGITDDEIQDVVDEAFPDGLSQPQLVEDVFVPKKVAKSVPKAAKPAVAPKLNYGRKIKL